MTKNYVKNDKKLQVIIILKLTDRKGPDVCCKKLRNLKECFIWSQSNCQPISTEQFMGKKRLKC